MTVKHTTEITCDLCGATNTHEYRWAILYYKQRNNPFQNKADICDKCYRKIADFLKREFDCDVYKLSRPIAIAD